MSAEGGPGSARLWGLTLGLAVTAALLGYFGLDDYLAGQGLGAAGFWERAYYTAQMFVLGSVPVENPPFNANLRAALLLAPLTTVLAVLQAVSTVFRAQYVAWRLRHTRGHAVVVGSGPAAFVLAQRLAGTGPTVLVGSDVRADVARRHHLNVVPGDPLDVQTLAAAGVPGAAEVFALSAGGSANAAVALLTRTLLEERRREEGRTRRWRFWARGRPLPSVAVYARADDLRLVAVLRARRLSAEGSDPDDGYTLDFFSVEQRAAVALLETHGDDPARHVAVVGSDPFARAVEAELTLRRYRAKSDATVTVVPTAHCDTVAPEVARVYVCATDPDEVMRTGLQLLLCGHAHVVLCLGRRSQLADALEQRLFDDVEGRLTVFGVLDAACDPDELRRRALVEQLARALHAHYLGTYPAPDPAAEPDGAPHSHVPWDRLADRFRDDNRAQAEHVGIKLATIGAVVVPAVAGLPDFVFDTAPDEHGDDEVERLAKMEHERWMQVKENAGVGWGVTRTGTTHPDYLPWARPTTGEPPASTEPPAPTGPRELSEAAKEKDRMFVRELPTLLRGEGLAIVRRPTDQGRDPT